MLRVIKKFLEKQRAQRELEKPIAMVTIYGVPKLVIDSCWGKSTAWCDGGLKK